MNSSWLYRTLAATPLAMLLLSTSLLGQGRLEVVGGDTYDWGQAPPAELKTTIVVKNVGSGDLKISDVRPSCNCATAPIDRSVLKPGESGKIVVTIDATNKEGRMIKTITVSSNDPANPQQVIFLKANIRPSLVFQPLNYFAVNNGTVGAETLARVTIVNHTDSSVTLYPAELVEGANVKARFTMKKKKVVKPGGKYELKVRVTPLVEGEIVGVIRVKTSTSDFPTIEFNLVGTASEPVAALPPKKGSASPPRDEGIASEPSGATGGTKIK